MAQDGVAVYGGVERLRCIDTQENSYALTTAIRVTRHILTLRERSRILKVKYDNTDKK